MVHNFIYEIKMRLCCNEIKFILLKFFGSNLSCGIRSCINMYYIFCVLYFSALMSLQILENLFYHWDKLKFFMKIKFCNVNIFIKWYFSCHVSSLYKKI